MKTAYFRCTPDKTHLQINFRYTNRGLCIDRDFNFCRNASEGVEIFLDRLKNNIEKELTKKFKKKISKKSNNEITSPENLGEKQLPTISVEILQENKPIHNITLEELFKNENENTNLVLRILKDDFKITYNLPWVKTVTLPSSILAGFILYPCKLELQYAEKKLCDGIWYKGLLPKSNMIERIEWQKIHEGLTYKTINEDVGHFIKFELIPKNLRTSGPSVECISKNEIQAGPGLCPFEERHFFTQNRLNDNEFRVISYNILADLYADSDFSRKELFPYCPPYALHIDYRKQLFIKEILGYNGDIICLQEVDGKIFENDLIQILEIDGFRGVFKQKGKTGEGLSTFFRKKRFEIIGDYSLDIGEYISKLDIFTSLWNKIKINEMLAERIVNLSTALQVSLLKSKETENYLLVANTHLYFHPDADHIRLLQIGLSIIYIENVYNKTAKNIGAGKTLSILFCGDFNSTPECGIYKLLTEKYVDENCIDWESNESQAVKGVNLAQPFNMQSACGCPEYTNFTENFFGCLDYIYYQVDNLDVKGIIPFPNDEEVKAHTAIPSVVFPSDHIALVADLKFR